MSKKIERETAERFVRDVASHQMTVLHDDGLYRHLRFKDPNHGFYWFDLVTWPGKLAFTGDFDGFVFSRLTDMFEFFRSNGNEHGINPGYWAEKIVDGRTRTSAYSEEKLRGDLEPYLKEHAEGYPDLLAKYRAARTRYDATPALDRYPCGSLRKPREPKSPEAIRELIQEYEDEGRLAYPDGARELLSKLETAGVVSDAWEWNLDDWDWAYLWCCHAIVWGIKQYDAARAEAGASC